MFDRTIESLREEVAFRKGWKYGYQEGRALAAARSIEWTLSVQPKRIDDPRLSPREVLEMYPHFRAQEVDCFLNGYGDGLYCDYYRIERMDADREARLAEAEGHFTDWRRESSVDGWGN